MRTPSFIAILFAAIVLVFLVVWSWPREENSGVAEELDGTSTSRVGESASDENSEGSTLRTDSSSPASESRDETTAEASPTIQRGLVVGPLGAPVAEALVELARITYSPGRVVAKTDGSGSFEIELDAGRHWLAARARGFGPATPVRLDAAEPGSERPELRLVLSERGASITGRVVNDLGEPVEGARVTIAGRMLKEAIGESEGPLDFATRTDAEGRFEALGLPRLPDLVLRVRAEGYARHAEHLDVLSGDQHVEVALQRPAALSGVARAGESSSIVDGRVIARRVDANRSTNPPFVAFIDANGHYEFNHLEPGSYEVRVLVKNRPQAEITMTFSPGERRTWNPQLVDERHLLLLRLVSDASAPLAGWKVEAVGKPTDSGSRLRHELRTDGAGRARAEESVEATFAVMVSPPDAETSMPQWIERDVRTGPEETVITVPRSSAPSARLRGVIHGPEGRAFGEGVRLTLYRQPFGSLEGVAVDPLRGTFETALLPPDDYHVLVTRRGFERTFFGPYTLNAFEIEDAGVLTLQPPGFAIVTIDRNAPAASVRYEVFDPQERRHDEGRTQKGEVLKIRLPPGSYELRATPDANFPVGDPDWKQTISFTIRPDERSDVVVTGR